MNFMSFTVAYISMANVNFHRSCSLLCLSLRLLEWIWRLADGWVEWHVFLPSEFAFRHLNSWAILTLQKYFHMWVLLIAPITQYNELIGCQGCCWFEHWDRLCHVQHWLSSGSISDGPREWQIRTPCCYVHWLLSCNHRNLHPSTCNHSVLSLKFHIVRTILTMLQRHVSRRPICPWFWCKLLLCLGPLLC